MRRPVLNVFLIFGLGLLILNVLLTSVSLAAVQQTINAADEVACNGDHPLEGQGHLCSPITNKGSGTIGGELLYQVAAPSIEIRKSVSINEQLNWEDADDPPGPTIMQGSELYFKFVVTNTGDVALTDVALTDSEFEDEIATLCSVPSLLAPHGSVGDWFDCVIGPLAAISGQHTNTAIAEGWHAGATYDDTDQANYFGLTADPAIVIEKSTNGADADTATGPLIPMGDPVFWTYAVTNTGNVDLFNVTVTDDDDEVTVDCGGKSTLAPTEAMTCTAGAIAVPGQYANVGTAEGYFGQSKVSNTDLSHYFGASPSIGLEKLTNWEDADTATGPLIPVGDPVFWTYAVTNTGNVDLTNVTVTDSKLGTICYIGDLEAGLSETCVATATAQPKQYENLGSAAAAFLGTPVSDEDYSHYYGVPWYVPSPTPVTPTPTNTPTPPSMSADAGARCGRWWVDLSSNVTAEYYVRVKLDGVTQVEETGIFTDSKILGGDWDLWGTGEHTMRITYWAKADGRQVGDDESWTRDCGTPAGPTPTPVAPTPVPVPPTPTPTPLVEVLAVESLPTTGVGVHPGLLGSLWLTAMGLLLVSAGSILRGLADGK